MSRGWRSAQVLHGKAELGQRAGLQVLHEHVGLGEDRLEQPSVLGPGQVRDHRLLAAVEPDEMRALPVDDGVVVAREIALGALELDHPRARVRQLAARERRGHRLVQREDEGAGEWFSHVRFRSDSARRGPLSPLAGRGLG